MANYLVTGVAGFIGSRVTELLLDEGHSITGLDNLNNAYDVRMKRWRLGRLASRPGFTFHQVDIGDRQALDAANLGCQSSYEAVINLAARAGVRQSLEDPWEK